MRKKSRAMDSGWALEVMHKAPYITVSFIDEDGKPYSLPLSFASDDDVNWYFHGALEGKKLEAIKAHPEVCLSAVTRCAPTVGPKDGSFTLQFKSAIAFGKAEIVTDEAEKIHGLRLICERFLPQHMDAFDENMLHSLLISEVKDYEECIRLADRFLPFVDNWAVCDIMSPKVFAKHKKELLAKIKTWSKSSHVYTCRFGIEILISHYLDKDFKVEYLEIPASVRSEEYYVK